MYMYVLHIEKARFKKKCMHVYDCKHRVSKSHVLTDLTSNLKKECA